MLFSFDPQVNRLGLTAASTEAAIREMGDALCAAGYVKDSFVDAVLDREKTYPTGLPFERTGIALPHTDVDHVIKPIIAVAVLEKPIKFQNMGDAAQSVDVEMIVMLAMKNSEFQLALLSRLIETLQDVAFVDSVLQAKTKEELTERMSKKINA